MSFSISLSLTALIKNEFEILFFRYLQKVFFAFGILDGRFEPTFTRKLLNVSAMEVLFAIILVSTNREFGYVLVRAPAAGLWFTLRSCFSVSLKALTWP